MSSDSIHSNRSAKPENQQIDRFILIDPSITSLLGHHLTYAATVLSAAKRRGWSTVVATHRTLEPAAVDELKHHQVDTIVPVFRHGHWLRPNEFPHLQRTERRLNRLFELLRAFTPEAWSFRLQRWKSGSAWQARPIRQLLECLLAVCLFMIALPLVICELLLPKSCRPGRAYSTFLLNLQRRQQLASQNWNIRAKQSDFCADLNQLAANIGLNQRDLIFIPSLSLDEIQGVGKWLSQSKVKGLNWHFVCRYDLFAGRVPVNQIERTTVVAWQTTLRRLIDSAGGHRLFFWTDTNELAEKYNSLGCGHFRSLPLPHTRALSPPRNSVKSPLIAIYLGDARQEKGFALLPELIEKLRRSGVSSDQLRFKLQSYINPVNADPVIVNAQNRLEALPDIDLITKSLTVDEYWQLLAEGDIVILLYDPAVYSARSSGILIEALTAGLPVLVRSHSWLSGQLQPSIDEHQLSLRKQTGTANESKPDLQQSDQPIGAAGVVCDDLDGAVAGLKDLVRYYPHYQRTARLLANKLLEYHNPDSLIDALLTGPPSANPPVK